MPVTLDAQLPGGKRPGDVSARADVVGQECDAARRAVLVARSGAGASSLDAPMADAEPVAELDYVA